MKYLFCDFYEDFKCIGDKCPSTCCAGGWGIIIDKDTKKEYDSIEGAFGQTLKRNIQTTDDSNYIFSLTRDGRCPFLTSENLCEIYQKLGPDKLCATCQEYPRIIVNHEDICFCTLTLSCPEVSRILLTRTSPISFFFEEDRFSDNAEHLTATDWDWFNNVMSCFTFSIDLLQNRTYSLSTRLRLLLIFTGTLQTLIDNNEDIAPLIETFSSPNTLRVQAESLSALPSNIPSIFSAFLHFYQHTKKIRNIPTFIALAKAMEDFINSYKGEELISYTVSAFHLLSDPTHDIHYERLCVYFLFRYYFRSYDSKNPLEEVAQLIYLLLIYRCYALPFCSESKGISTEKQIELFSSISRIFDHNTENLDMVSSYFKKDGQTDISFLLALI